MVGNIVAWILGVLSAGILIAAERRRGRQRENYRRELLREFSGEYPEEGAASGGSDEDSADSDENSAGDTKTGKKQMERG